MEIFEINKVYKFNTISPNVLGASFKGAKLLNKYNYFEAIKKYPTITLLNSTVFTTINRPPLDPTDMVWLEFLVKDNKMCLSLDWIDLKTVELDSTNRKVVLTFIDISESNRNLLLQVLKDLELNYTIDVI
jgi:hypothetical protein